MGLGIIKTASNMSATFLLVNIVIILLAEPSPIFAADADPVLTLYGENEKSITISSRNSPNLGELDFDDIARSCQAQGLWILYAEYNYFGAFQLMNNTYKKLEHSLSGKVSSVRLVGTSNNYLDCTLTLYQGINFQGREVYNYDANSNLDGSASSLIVTGSEPWTIYSASNFGGNTVCINSMAVYDLNQLRIQRIRSVRRGCVE